MNLCKRILLGRVWAVVCLLFLSIVTANAQNIRITLSDEYFDCQSGNLYFNYHISISDGYNSDYLSSFYGVSTGTFNTGTQTAEYSEYDGSYSGPYTAGDAVVIWAQGYNNNNAPYTNYIFYPTIATPMTPTITVSGNPVCNGSRATLEAQGWGGTFQWSNGYSGQTFSTDEAGSYRVRVVNYCGAGAYSDPVVISVGSTPPAPTIAASGNTFLCNGETVTLSASTQAGGIITWSTGETGNNITVSSAGSYYAYETGSCGASPNSNTITVTTGTAPAAPSVTPSGPLTLCDGNSVTLSIPGGGNTNWFKDDGLVAANSGTLVVNTAGSYKANLNNACGFSGFGNIVVVTTAATPPPPSVSPAGPILLCNGNTTVLSASGNGAIAWLFNGSPVSSGASLSVGNPGSYTATASNGCGTSAAGNTVSISTANTPPAPSLNITGSVTLCNGAGQVLSTAAGAGGTIRWSTGEIANAITVYNAGTYYAYENNACGNGPSSPVVSISTLNTPVAPTVTPPGNQLLCNGQSATLNASGTSITWSNGATGNTISVNSAGTYYAYDHNYCGNSANSNAVIISTGTCPTPTPGSAFFICPGALKTLDAGAGYDTYNWSNGASTRTISVGPGTYSVTVTRNGCAATSSAVTVSYYSGTIPVINTSGPTMFCAGNSVTLSSSAANAYNWSNGATSQNIVVTVSGSYTVTVTDANGCQASSAATTVTVNPLPAASISGNNSACQGSSSPVIHFTGSGGTAPYTFFYTINGGSTQAVSSSGNTATVNAATGSAGTFVYALTGVSESSSTNCYSAANGAATVTINAAPGATIAGNATVCQNASSPSIIFTGTGGTPPYTFTYSLNGSVNQTISSSGGNSASLSVSTNVPGNYTYTLVGVRESSGLGCTGSAGGTATVVVRPVPMATIAGNATLCKGSSSSGIVITGSNGSAPYTFNYTVNGGPIQTVSSGATNTVTVPVQTTTPGVFTYQLLSVAESGGCTYAADGSVIVTIRDLPTAAITGSTTVCLNSSAPLISITGANGTAPYTFIYSLNGGANQTISTVSGNSVALAVPTATAGSYSYNLVSVRESGAPACTAVAGGNATILVKALPTATISGSTTVCQNSSNVLLTLNATGTSPFTFSYNINGGATQTASTSSGNSVTVSVPTSIPGSYTYNLTGVQESGSAACSNTAGSSATVVVNPLPTASVSGTATVCQNSPAPTVVFTGSGGMLPYTFYYSINGGATQSITTATGNSVSINPSTQTSGSFSYALISVKDGSGTACANTASGTAVIVVNPQPAAAVLVSPNTHLCNGETGQLSIYNWTEGFTYTWYKDGQLLTTAAGQTMAISQAGSYTVIVTSNTGCNAATPSNAVIITTGSVPAPVITGSLRVCEGGETDLAAGPSDRTGDYALYRWTDTPIGDTLCTGKHFSAAAGRYQLLVAKQGCYDSLKLTVTADDTEYPAGSLDIYPRSVPYGGRATITAQVKGAAQYEWDLGDSLRAVTFSNKIQHQFFANTDSLPISVTAISARNCKTSIPGLVRLGRPDTLVFANRQQAGNLKDWNLFPVPFHRDLHLSVILTRSENFRVDLFTLEGRWVRSWSFYGKAGENLYLLTNTETLPVGVFYTITAVYNKQKHFDLIYKY